MKYFVLSLLMLATTLSSCDECKYADCNFGTSLRFTLKNSQGESLFEGAAKRFDIDSVEVYELNGADTVALSPYIGNTFIEVTIMHKDVNSLLVKYDSSTYDKLDLGYLVTPGKCCGDVLDIQKITVNGNMLCEPCNSNNHTIVK